MKNVFAVSIMTLSLLGGAHSVAFAATADQIAQADRCIALNPAILTDCLPLFAQLTTAEFQALAASNGLTPVQVAEVEDSVNFATGDVGAPAAGAPAPAAEAPAAGAPASETGNSTPTTGGSDTNIGAPATPPTTPS